MKGKQSIKKICDEAKKASYSLVTLKSKKKKEILLAMAKALETNVALIMRENKKDLAYGKNQKLSSAMMDRLAVDKKRVQGMAKAVREVAGLKDTIGEVMEEVTRPNGLRIQKVCVPLGVILIIYEARPNVTAECASLCLKTNNVVILRGGKEAFYTNQIIVKLFKQVLRRFKVSENIIQFVATTDRKAVDLLLKQNESINLVIPRGGEGLIRKVAELSTIPVIKHYKGICHTYVDASANLKMAIAIAENAKCQRPSVCNAMETLLVHQDVYQKFLPRFADRFAKVSGKMNSDAKAYQLLKGRQGVRKANQNHFETEYLDLELSVKVVKDIDEAIAHINRFGSSHTDTIVTKNKKNAEQFLTEVDSSSVMVNASSRFADGNEYGLGAEIGISTDKIHARGPMGIDGLTTYKYCVLGTGQIRE